MHSLIYVHLSSINDDDCKEGDNVCCSHDEESRGKLRWSCTLLDAASCGSILYFTAFLYVQDCCDRPNLPCE
jgi:hypothetical protein